MPSLKLKSYSYHLITIALLFVNGVSFSQGLTCDVAEPFCADSAGAYVFENTTNSGSAEPGINYGCLQSTPNPAWFFIQIDQDGDLFFTIEQNSSVDFTGAPIDVDFIAWGPFSNTNTCNQLTPANQVPGSCLIHCIFGMCLFYFTSFTRRRSALGWAFRSRYWLIY